METDEQPQGTDRPQHEGETVEDFKREMEEDPSRAPADDPDLERQRGG